MSVSDTDPAGGPEPVPRPTHPWVAEGARRVRFGVLGGAPFEWASLRRVAHATEELGLDSYWVPDHPLQRMACWTVLAALAATTARIRLGTLVACPAYRNPVVLARQAADVDQISDGRFVLGLGAGDRDWEFAQMGLRFPPLGERSAVLEETLRVVPPLLAGATVEHAGAHLRVAGARLQIAAVQQPHIPVLVAGGGERVRLRQVAQYADACNVGGSGETGGARTVEDVRRKRAALDAHCADLGRAPDTVLRSHFTGSLVLGTTGAAARAKVADIPDAALARRRDAGEMVVGTPEEATLYYHGLIEAGMRYFIVALRGDDTDTLRLLAEQVAPALRARTATTGPIRTRGGGPDG